MVIVFAYVREMIVKKCCKYGEYGSSEYLFFFSVSVSLCLCEV